MNAASVLVLVVVLVLAALATWYCRAKGAPCEGGCACTGCCAKCKHRCAQRTLS